MNPPLVSFALFGILCSLACAEEKAASGSSDPLSPHRYAVPEVTNDGWETASLRSAGFSTALMDELLQRVSNDTYKNTHSVLVVKSGKLIFEEYFPGEDSQGRHQDFNRDTLHTQQSATKSVNSILIGIAIDQHLISGVEEKVSTFFPEYSELFEDEGKGALNLKDCLSMTAGLAWLENGVPYTDPRNEAVSLNRSPDPIRYVFDRPLAEAPGQKFLYNSGISIVLEKS